VWLVGGGSGHGFKFGPALGEYVAARVQGRAAIDPVFGLKRLTGFRSKKTQFDSKK
jgi:glycine/D-amino acid oxidase-like deaminating enzyme